MERGFRPGSFSYIRFLGELSGASENSSSCSSTHAARWTHAANVSLYKLVARTVLVHQTAAPQNPQALRSLVRKVGMSDNSRLHVQMDSLCTRKAHCNSLERGRGTRE